MTKKKKVKRVVLGVGMFGFDNKCKTVDLWRSDNKSIKKLSYSKLISLECKKVRLIAEVLE